MTTTIRPVNLELNRLENMSESGYYNPYTLFDWPEKLESDRPWMSEDLVSLAGTEMWDELTREQQLELTRYEAINFFSLNVHGIRELLSEVVLRIHTRIYHDASEFLHHFIGEENEHMWFFARFCERYGGKLYPPQPSLPVTAAEGLGEQATELVVFARILIFEEIVDYFNAAMATDESLPFIAQEINRVHHQDESRHVAFGRQIFVDLLDQMKAKSPEDVPAVARYLESYLGYSLASLYNPAVYRDAGLPNPIGLRRRALTHPARAKAHDQILKRTRRFLDKCDLGVTEGVA